MAKYRKKPVVIEALDWFGNFDKAREFVTVPIKEDICECTITIPTLEGDMVAKRGDYIIKGVDGEFYPCKRDIFEKTYDKVEE